MIFVNRYSSAVRNEITTTIQLILIFFILASNSILAQTELQKQYDYAYSLFGDEKYFDAITEFKRLQFFDSLNQYSFLSNKLIGMSYKQGGKFYEAINYFSKAELISPNDDSLFTVKIEIIKTNLLRRTIYRAFDLLNELNEYLRFNSKKDQITYWRGWAYIFNDEWQKAADEFDKLAGEQELKKLCENVSDAHYSPKLAKILSYVLPGAGQFYTGNYVSGILSFGWVALWTYISVHAFLADRIFDGVMVADFLAFRFYNGNLQNAEKFAIERNSEASSWMLNYLQNNFSGMKP
jgi:tetratricopeptide (TPR) repeat protein